MVALVTGHVAQIDVVKASLQRSLPGHLQRLDGRGGQIHKLVVGMEAAEMEGHIGADGVQHPIDQRTQFRWIVIQAGYHQVDDLEVDAHLVDGTDGSQHRLQRAAAHLPIKVLVVAFQVDLDGVHGPAQFAQRLRVDIASRDDRIAQPGTAGQTSRVQHVFVEYHGLRIGIGDRLGSLLDRGANDGLWRCIVALEFFRRVLGDIVVLAVLAAQAASRRGQRKRDGAG